jgi:hypothetical protein
MSFNSIKSSVCLLFQVASGISHPDDRNFVLPLKGGYFKRFRGGALQPWVQHPDYRDKMTLEERITLTFLQVRYMVPLHMPIGQDLISLDVVP